jgi:hypothetical protein
MKQLNIIILSLGVILFSSCKKEDVKPNTIKYEVTSTYSGEMEIQYRNEFGNSNSELVSGGSWTKSFEVGTEKYYLVSPYQDLGLNNLVNHNITAKIYYNGVLVNENSQQGTTGISALASYSIP